MRLTRGDKTRAIAPADPVLALEVALVGVAVAVGWVGWSGVVLTELGRFSGRGLGALVGVAGIGGVVGVVRARRARRAATAPGQGSASDLPAAASRAAPDRSSAGSGGWPAALALLAMPIVAALLVWPPSVIEVWAGDATVALNVARQLTVRGSSTFEDPALRGFDGAERSLLFANRTRGDATGPWVRFPGGFAIVEPEADRVAAGFSPLYPALSAALLLVSRPAAVRFVSPLFAALAVLAITLVGRRAAGTRGGLIAGAAVAVALPQIWFAKAGATAPVAQFFVFTGLLALARATESRRLAWQVAAGVLLGLATFASADLIVTIGLAMVALLALHLAGRRALEIGLFAPFAALAIHAIAHYAIVPSHYVPWLLGRLRSSPGWALGAAATGRPWLLGAATLGAALLISWIARRLGGRVVASAGLGALLLAGLAVYATTSNPNLSRSAAWLYWYLSWPALILAVVGAAGAVGLALRRGRPASARRHELARWLAFLSVASLPYLLDPQVTGEHPESIRRFVPVVIPALLLAAAGGVVALAAITARIGRARRADGVVAGALATVLIGSVATASLPVIGQRFGAESATPLADLASAIPDGATVFASPDLAGTHLATSLAYLRDRKILMVQPERPGAAFADLLLRRLRGEREVFLLLGTQGLHFPAPMLRLESRGAFPLALRTLAVTRDARPDRVVEHTTTPMLFRVRAGGSEDGVVDIGSPADDTLHDLSGFYGAEREPAPSERTFRWTGSVANITIPCGSEVSVTIGDRPPGAATATVGLWLDNRPALEQVTVGPARTVLRVTHPLAHPGECLLTIRSTTFRPSDLGGDDDRALGLKIYQIAVANVVVTGH